MRTTEFSKLTERESIPMIREELAVNSVSVATADSKITACAFALSSSDSTSTPSSEATSSSDSTTTLRRLAVEIS